MLTLSCFVSLCKSAPRLDAVFPLSSSGLRMQLTFCPYASPYVTVRGVFTKTIHQYVLMLAVYIHLNSHGVIAGWGIGFSDSMKTWPWFCVVSKRF